MNLKILLCDDDPIVHEALGVYFEKYNISFVSAYNGRDCLNIFKSNEDKFDLIILDIMMPYLDGIEVCKRIRSKSDIPIIMLTAKSEEIDTLLGFELGADDYITKPFSSMEVIARIRAIVSRSKKKDGRSDDKKISFEKVEVDLSRYTLIVDGQIVHATPKEIEVLFLLMNNPKKVFTRSDIMKSVWGFEYAKDTRTVDTHIKRIRAKLTPYVESCIQTVYGMGYKFDCINEDV